jgi:preprotein translocase subunit YajC
MTIVMLVVLAALIFFMFRSSSRRKKQAAELQEKVVPGAEVMTNFGLFGTIVSIDAENNKVELETSPGQVVTVHRQTVSRVIEPDAPVDETENAIEDGDQARDPEFGERVDAVDEPRETASGDSADGKTNA